MAHIRFCSLRGLSIISGERFLFGKRIGITYLGEGDIMRILFAGLVVIGVSLIWNADSALAASLDGTWSGSGTVQPDKGEKEKARCRAVFKKYSEKSYKVAAKCSIPSLGVVRQVAVVKKTGENKYTGKFFNSDYNVRGIITIIVKGDKQTVSLKADAGSAFFTFKKTNSSAKLD